MVASIWRLLFDRTRDLRDTGAMLYQLSYEATHWERGQFIEFISPVRPGVT